MGTKMKGLLKGLRYISQIFDPKEEQEMQIGYPTDVKHVAHIGVDGPSASSPAWMKDMKSGDGDSHANVQEADVVASSPTRRSSRHRASDSAAPLSTSSSGGTSRHTRRHQSASATASGGSDSPKSSRRPKHRTGNAAETGSESPNQGAAGVPKQRRRKPKMATLSGGSSEGSTRSKGDEL